MTSAGFNYEAYEQQFPGSRSAPNLGEGAEYASIVEQGGETVFQPDHPLSYKAPEDLLELLGATAGMVKQTVDTGAAFDKKQITDYEKQMAEFLRQAQNGDLEEFNEYDADGKFVRTNWEKVTEEIRKRNKNFNDSSWFVTNTGSLQREMLTFGLEADGVKRWGGNVRLMWQSKYLDLVTKGYNSEEISKEFTRWTDSLKDEALKNELVQWRSEQMQDFAIKAESESFSLFEMGVNEYYSDLMTEMETNSEHGMGIPLLWDPNTHNLLPDSRKALENLLVDYLVSESVENPYDREFLEERLAAKGPNKFKTLINSTVLSLEGELVSKRNADLRKKQIVRLKELNDSVNVLVQAGQEPLVSDIPNAIMTSDRLDIDDQAARMDEFTNELIDAFGIEEIGHVFIMDAQRRAAMSAAFDPTTFDPNDPLAINLYDPHWMTKINNVLEDSVRQRAGGMSVEMMESITNGKIREGTIKYLQNRHPNPSSVTDWQEEYEVYWQGKIDEWKAKPPGPPTQKEIDNANNWHMAQIRGDRGQALKTLYSLGDERKFVAGANINGIVYSNDWITRVDENGVTSIGMQDYMATSSARESVILALASIPNIDDILGSDFFEVHDRLLRNGEDGRATEHIRDAFDELAEADLTNEDRFNFKRAYMTSIDGLKSIAAWQQGVSPATMEVFQNITDSVHSTINSGDSPTENEWDNYFFMVDYIGSLPSQRLNKIYSKLSDEKRMKTQAVIETVSMSNMLSDEGIMPPQRPERFGDRRLVQYAVKHGASSLSDAEADINYLLSQSYVQDWKAFDEDEDDSIADRMKDPGLFVIDPATVNTAHQEINKQGYTFLTKDGKGYTKPYNSDVWIKAMGEAGITIDASNAVLRLRESLAADPNNIVEVMDEMILTHAMLAGPDATIGGKLNIAASTTHIFQYHILPHLKFNADGTVKWKREQVVPVPDPVSGTVNVYNINTMDPSGE
jgi:hypothetical protein